MWIYEKKLQYPVRIKNPNPALEKIIISQYGGPDGELGASLRYLSQRYSMPTGKTRAFFEDFLFCWPILCATMDGKHTSVSQRFYRRRMRSLL